MDMPYFLGGKDPYVYLKWVQQLDEIFDSLEISDFQKCKLASSKFLGRAAIWWKDLMALLRENGNDEVRNWELMKRLMTRHFIPYDVRDKFYLKLQKLKQGDELSVDDYARKFKLFVIASDIGKSEGQKIKG